MSDSQNESNLAVQSVSVVAGSIKSLLEQNFGRLRVQGELGRVTQPQSGHLYLDLKDDNAVLAGVMWRGGAQRLAFTPETGLEVVCTGRITTYGPQSRYQLVIDEMEPAGQGALIAKLEQARKKFAEQGLFAEERKKPLPMLPQTIGVITSPTGAVLRDILHRLRERCPARVLVWGVRVQGEQCAGEVARAIAGFNAMTGANRPDVLVVARGGGSLEDLWGFNEEAVVLAAAKSAIPLVSAIGHETDMSLLDYVADYRAPTPTQAAERIVPVRAELLAGLAQQGARLASSATRTLNFAQSRVDGLARGLARPQDMLHLRQQRYDELAGRLATALNALWKNAALRLANARLSAQSIKQNYRNHATQLAHRAERLARALQGQYTQATQRLTQATRTLAVLDHEATLQRGFALVSVGEKLLRDPEQAPKDTELQIRLRNKKTLSAISTK